MTGNLSEANKSYSCLEEVYRIRIKHDMKTLVWGLILIPLSDDRKRISDHFHYLYEYINHL